MRILMLGNSFTSTNHMPQMLAALTCAQVVHHTRGGARLSEHLNPNTKLGARTQAALRQEHWDYVVLQEMSHGGLPFGHGLPGHIQPHGQLLLGPALLFAQLDDLFCKNHNTTPFHGYLALRLP